MLQLICYMYNSILSLYFHLDFFLEPGETLLCTRSSRDNSQNVETNGLRKRSALANDHSITFMATESRGDVGRDVLVALLVTLVLFDVMKVISANDNCTVHLGALDTTAKDTTTDGYVSSEGAFVIDVGSLDSLLGSLESKANIFEPARTTFSRSLAALLSNLLVAAKYDNEFQ